MSSARMYAQVHSKLRRFAVEGRAITKKPFLVLTSKGDDVLNGDETMVRPFHSLPSTASLAAP